MNTTKSAIMPAGTDHEGCGMIFIPKAHIQELKRSRTTPAAVMQDVIGVIIKIANECGTTFDYAAWPQCGWQKNTRAILLMPLHVQLLSAAGAGDLGAFWEQIMAARRLFGLDQPQKFGASIRQSLKAFSRPK